MANKKGTASPKASNPPVKKPNVAAPKALAPKTAPAKAPVKVYSSPPKPITPKPIQSPAKAASVMNSPKPSSSAPTSTAGSRVASSMTSVAGKTAAKTVGKSIAKTVGKTLLKGVPYVGAAIAGYELADAAYSAYKANKAKKAESSPSTGEGIKKYMTSGPSSNATTKGPVKPGARSAASVTQQKSADSYYSKLAGNKPSGSPAKRKVVRTTSAAISAPKREMPSGISKPSVPGVQKGPEKRQFSDTEVKTMTAMKKGTQANGTMSEDAQRKIASIRAKARVKEARVERKSQRVEKRAAVKAVRKSYKK